MRRLGIGAFLLLAATSVEAEDLASLRVHLTNQMALENYQMAAELGAELTERAPFDAAGQLLYGQALVELERWPEAVEALERATRLRPDLIEGWKLLGYAHYELEQPHYAIEALRRAARQNPTAFMTDEDGAMTLLFFAEMDSMPRLIFVALALLVVLMSVILHELAHAGSASLLGDPTPGALGRLTLNPLAHVDPIGTVLLPLLLVATQAGIVLGYARPVPFWPENFRRPRFDRILTAMAGPLSNLLILAGCALLGRLAVPLLVVRGLSLWPVHVLFLAALINAFLALLNALPIFPLDGGHLVATFLPSSWGPQAEGKLALVGILLILLLLTSGVWDGLLRMVEALILLLFGI